MKYKTINITKAITMKTRNMTATVAVIDEPDELPTDAVLVPLG